jgi:hypothetical protein
MNFEIKDYHVIQKKRFIDTAGTEQDILMGRDHFK